MRENSCGRTHLLAIAAVVLLGCSEGDPAPAGDASDRAAAAPARASDASDPFVVASWNIEWFGDPTNGPASDDAQRRGAARVIRETDADVWGLAEIVDEAQWRRLLEELGTRYDGVLASDRRVDDGRRWYGAREQKLALLFDRDRVRLLRARVILSQHDADFAGRPPLEATLRVRTGGAEEEVVVIAVHLKARADAESWARRERASRALKRYLDAEHPSSRLLVVGDWNDGIGRSITAGRETPFAAFVADSARYRFLTRDLSRSGSGSTGGNGTLIDHQLASDELLATLVEGSVRMERPDDRRFRSTISDHFPIRAAFVLRP